ncbi:succinic semialdehyde dehydrogenase [Cellulomonas denverensis]|uniref:Aldehyde dehydrogenase family protein n=1 Tax=Cellulomonas denverensis TaxID=264297 RepID=A0A7X6KXB7_9CELL|nr:succinic semialdehyde dehydrogenase [Cellulomonas denverensis]NKY23645.1 aldehyde dehydrogenase family protein [Cellulomonas denverensis]GIG26875.1 succinic semialdehyde dehydrogenase [Cellulomonas denverensis]
MVPEALRDPETDPLATLVLEPELVADLVRRARATGPHATHHAPWTGAPLATLPQSTPEDLAAAARTARAAQRRWAVTGHRERAALLRRTAQLVLARQSDVLDLIQLENGKARAAALEEVADVVLGARFLAGHAGRVLAEQRRPGLLGPLTSVRVARDPAGVVAVVAPWNYPLSLTLGDVLPALAAGNAVLLRPDPQTPLTALWAAELLADAGFPDDLVQVVLGDGPTVGDRLIDHADHLLFTGSTATGRLVAARAGGELVPSTLELGGKNALYVAGDADPDLAAEGAVRACFGGTGQLCMSVERLYVHRDVAAAFSTAFRRRVRALRLGTGLDYGYDLGSLTGPEQLARVVEHVEDALSGGARLLTGGAQRPEIGPYVYEPTVLTDVGPHARMFAEETFGPVVALGEVRSDDEAVAAMNDTRYGLHAAVWSGSVRRGRAVADRLRVGSVDANEGYQASWGSWAAPQGGRADSGWGARHGAEGLLALTRSRTVAVQRGVHAGLGPGRLLSGPPEHWAPLLLSGLRLLSGVRPGRGPRPPAAG